MDPDCYKVDILYYLNPHLIWVEVVDSKRDEEFVFEQIGIYGLLPYETTIELDNESFKCQRTSDWVAAASVVMKKTLSHAKEVIFRPTFIDRRTSIFDDNIHKYGELIIMTADGAKLKLTDILVESGFALHDVCLFHKELSLGNIKTQLSSAMSREVIKQLENTDKEREKGVRKKTTVLHAAQDFENVLTTQNLERHNRQVNWTTVDSLIQRKMKDFSVCKDFDEDSIGRGVQTKRNAEENKPSLLLKKKMELMKLQQSKMVFKEQKRGHSDPLKVLLETKQFLEKNAKYIGESDSTTSGNVNYEQTPDKKVACCQNIGSENSSKAEQKDIGNSNEPTNYSENSRRKVKKSPKQNKIPEYDIATEKRVAYGPPGFDHKHLPLKIIPKQTHTDDVHPVSAVYEKKEVVFTESYADIDSHINLEISNRDTLEKLIADKENIADNTKDTSIEEFDPKVNVSATECTEDNKGKSKFAILQKKLKLHKELSSRKSECSATSHSDTTNKDSSSDNVKSKRDIKKSESSSNLDSDDDDIAESVKKINEKYGVPNVKPKEDTPKDEVKAAKPYYKNNVNPFKNVDASMSVFVDKLVAPVLMVHSKMNQRFEPCSNIRDVNFNTHIHIVLKNMLIEHPMMLQMISWPVILRGFSLFMVSRLGSGKTMGYLPAVCRLVSDFNCDRMNSVGPTCIIVCATAQGVSEVERLARMFLGLEDKVLACYAGMDELHVTTSLLNGCNLFICTPPILVRLLQLTEFGVDLRRLATFVLDDCERLSEVYTHEIKVILSKIKEMYKQRVHKEFKVQIIAASRVWCDFMEPLAKKAPNSVICIGAFEECVLYSKANTVVDFVQKDNKTKHVLEFLKDIDSTKKTVIVCGNDEEVDELNKILLKHKYVVFACNSTMTVEELYSLSKSWVEYEEPLLGPILICCDGNLIHLNATDANYLIHYSLPQLFSMFCKRFSVLNDNYSSIFNEEKKDVKIKVLLDEHNVEQLPKILNFIKRCTDNVPEFLGTVSDKILQEKDVVKGKKHVPVCNSLMALGECPDFWNCQERHRVFNEYDEPKEWVPRSGVVTFVILHYHTAIHYSARLLSCSTKGTTKKYPPTHSMLSLRMGMYFSQESNKKLQGIPHVGDVCAVRVKQNFFCRCQVIKILDYYNNGTPNWVRIKLLDEEKLERARDIDLFYLPNELREIETHVVQVRLANICPKDNDVTFSDLAKDELKKITDEGDDLYLRGQVLMTIGNCVFVDTLDVCQALTSLNEIVVRYNFKKELLDTHAVSNPDHIIKLQAVCKNYKFGDKEVIIPFETAKKVKPLVKPQWAHLEEGDSEVFFTSAISPDTFFVRLLKFHTCTNYLYQEIDKYVETKPTTVSSPEVGDIVLAKFPEDKAFYRARVDEIIDDNKVKCFFVDDGDWNVVLVKDLLEIPEKMISFIPFQAIECSLVGIEPVGNDWPEFATNWFADNCSDMTNDGIKKRLFVKYFTKKEATYTNGKKYGVVMTDTNDSLDIIVNRVMIDLNLAQAKEDELHFLGENKISIPVSDDSSTDTQTVTNEEDPKNVTTALVAVNTPKETNSLDNIFLKKPIRSVPLVDSDTDDSDRWEIVNPKELIATLIPKASQPNPANKPTPESKVTPVNKPAKNVVNIQHITKQEAKTIPEKEFKTALTKVETKTAVKKESKTLSTTLDSDDLSSADGSQLSEKPKEIPISIIKQEIDEFRKPKLVWRQNKSSVSIKIQLIGADDYNLEIKERSLKFRAYSNDTNYGFDFELYGVIEAKNSRHSNKGQYILVTLVKVMKKNWLTLTKDGGIKKWIVYDVDSIDTSSDEEEEVVNHMADVARNIHEKDNESDSDDELLDDINYEYKRDYD